MTLISVVKDVCAVVGVTAPQSVFTNITGNRTMQEMVSLANEMAQRIAYDYRDWTKLRTTVTYAGNGIITAFNLPANYKRMLLTANVWRSTSNLFPMAFVSDTDEWLNHRLRSYTHMYGEWTLLGGQIHVYPVMPVGQSAYFAYMDKNCVALNGGGFGDSFLNDLDGFVLDERLLKLGMIMQWKMNKGGAYAEDMGTFGDAMAVAMGHDSPAPIIVDRRVLSAEPANASWGSWPT